MGDDDEAVWSQANRETSYDILEAKDTPSQRPNTLMIKRSIDEENQEKPGRISWTDRKRNWRANRRKKLNDPETPPEEKARLQAQESPRATLAEAAQVLDADEMEHYRGLAEARNRYSRALYAKKQAEEWGRPLTDEQLNEWDEAVRGYAEYAKVSRDVFRKFKALREANDDVLSTRELREQQRAEMGTEVGEQKEDYQGISFDEVMEVLDPKEMEGYRELIKLERKYASWRKRVRKKNIPLTDAQQKERDEILADLRKYRKFSSEAARRIRSKAQQVGGAGSSTIQPWEERLQVLVQEAQDVEAKTRTSWLDTKEGIAKVRILPQVLSPGSSFNGIFCCVSEDGILAAV